MELTAAGHALLPHAREVLGQLNIAAKAAKMPHGRTLGYTGAMYHLSHAAAGPRCTQSANATEERTAISQ